LYKLTMIEGINASIEVFRDPKD
jgi:hypothetical protein